MKRILAILLAIVFVATPLTALATRDVYEVALSFTYSKDGTTIPYRVILPENYSDTKKYPMLLFLHGAGERGNDNKSQFVNCVQYISDNLPEECIIVAPQCPTDQQWVDVGFSKGTFSFNNVAESNELKAVVSIVGEVQTAYSIDSDRIYATGLSMGGYGTWDLMSRHNDIFAAAMPICGGGDPNQADILKHTPLYIFHGDVDDVVPVTGSRNMVNALKEQGSTSYEYSELIGWDHGVWNEAYKTEGILEKLFSHKLSDRYPISDKPATVSGNLALNKETSVSGLEVDDGRFTSDLAVDGDETTRVSFARDKDEQWLIVDLGAEYSVKTVEIAFAQRVSSYAIWTSVDGIDYTKVYTVSGLEDEISAADKIELETPVTARYVKYQQLDRIIFDDYPDWGEFSGGINEFRVFSADDKDFSQMISTAKTFLSGINKGDSRYDRTERYCDQLEAYIKRSNFDYVKANGLYDALEAVMAEDFVTNLAFKKSYETYGIYTQDNVAAYPDEEGKSLTDGISADSEANYDNQAFVGFNTQTDEYIAKGYASVTVDLGEEYSVNKFVARVSSENDTNKNAGVGVISNVSFFVSKDGTTWKKAGSATPVLSSDDGDTNATLTLESSVLARYIQYRFKSTTPWMMISEVEAYEGAPTNDDFWKDSSGDLTFVLSDDETYYIVSACDEDATTVVIPETYKGLPVKEIGENAFYEHSNLTSVTILNSVTTIRYNAFGGCVGLTSVTISDSVTTIENYAFGYCINLSNVHIPASVTSLNVRAFNDCDSLETITVDSENDVYYSVNNCIIEKFSKTLVIGIKPSVIPDDGSVVSIGESAFYQCYALESITIPDSITSIGHTAFYDCDSLTSITIPDSVTTMGMYVFYSCENLTDIYCEAESQPGGWDTSSGWLGNCKATVHWGVGNNDPIDPPSEEKPKVIKGDINGKDGIDSMDYVLLKRAYFGTYTLKDIKVGDINDSGVIDSMDYVLLKRVYFGTYVIK